MILIAGPCAMESATHALDSAFFIQDVVKKYNVDFYFKSSFEKANRTNAEALTGVGLEEALVAFASLKQLGIKTTTDVHESHHPKELRGYVDVIQIPAMLSRQTPLIKAAADVGKIVNIKKGQFMSAQQAKEAAKKAAKAPEVWLTERGNFFGYGDIVVDFRNIVIMKEENPNCKIIFDATHSAGKPKMARQLAKAAVAMGVDGLFIETHENPGKAISDNHLMVPFSDLDGFLEEVLKKE